jgi:hypothetical protein
MDAATGLAQFEITENMGLPPLFLPGVPGPQGPVVRIAVTTTKTTPRSRFARASRSYGARGQ